MEFEWSFDDSEVIASGYDHFKFKEVLKQSEEYLVQLNPEKRLEIIKELLKNPNFDDTDVYYLAMIEMQDPSYKPPSVVSTKPPKRNRFVMGGMEPIRPIWGEENAVTKAEKTSRKRPRDSSDCEFDEEEEKDRVIKKRANKKKVNNLVKKWNVDLLETKPDLPDEFKERIRYLGGTEATLVIQKVLFPTDVSSGHGRLSLPQGELIEKEFLRRKEKAFLANRKDGLARMEVGLIAENGKEHEIDIRQWNGTYNVVKGWNNVVSEHGLRLSDVSEHGSREAWLVQLWSFRVEGKLWFALVKLRKVKERD